MKSAWIPILCAVMLAASVIFFFQASMKNRQLKTESEQQKPATMQDAEKKLRPSIAFNVNLKALAEKFHEGHPDQANWERELFLADELSAYFLFLNKGQFLPLSLNRAGREWMIVVDGTCSMLNIYGNGSQTMKQTLGFREGDIAVSGKASARELNNSSNEKYFSAVLLSSPPFAGHFFVKENDKELKKGEQSTKIASPSIQEEIKKKEQRFISEDMTPIGEIQVKMVQIATDYKKKTDRKTMFYTFTGEGLLQTASAEMVNLSSGQITVVEQGAEITVFAKKVAPLAMLELSLPDEKRGK